MTQVNPNSIQTQKLSTKTEVLLAPKKRKKLSTDKVTQASKTPTIKRKGVVSDPLANLPAGKEQAGEGGGYYPPAGMPGVYYAMKALLLDLKAGLNIAHIDNEIMTQQYQSWAEALDTFAKKSKELYDQQSREALWSGISSIVSTAGSLISIGGSAFNLYKSEANLKGLTEEKNAINSNRFDDNIGELKKIKAPESKLKSKLVISEDENEGTELTTFKDSSKKDSVEMSIASEEEKGSPPHLEPLDSDWKVNKKESLSVQRQRVLKEKTLLQEEQQEKPEIDKSEFEQARSIYNDRLKSLELADKDFETQVKDIEDKIAQKNKKSEQIGQMFYQAGNLATAAQQLVSGFSKATISTAQGQIDYDKNMADKYKSLEQMVTQGYEQQTNKVFQTIDQLLSTIEGTIAKLYAAQQSGAA